MATQQQPSTTLALTPAQVQQLSPQQQQQYLQSLSPQMQAIYQAELVNMQNADFMRNSIRKFVYCPVTGGSGTTATFSNGTTLNFDLPTTQGYAVELWIKYSLTVTPASGTNATYQLTPAGKYAIFNRIVLTYGPTQINTHPYVFRLQDIVEGRSQVAQNGVQAGLNDDSAIDAQIVGSTPLVVGSGNTWQGYFRLRLNPINKESPFGALPLNGVGNNPQLQITCSPNLYGADPLLNSVCSGGTGTGQAVTVTGTVKVDAVVIDGTNLESITAKSLSGLLSMPTMQYYWESNLTPLNQGLQTPFTIKTKLEHWQLFAVVIDGQQSNAFVSGLSNFSNFGLSPDATLQQYLINIGVSNNIPIWDWYAQQRDRYKQDIDEGVIVWANAPGVGVVDANNRNGSAMINCYPDGYPAMTHVYTVAATGSVCTPRVELFAVSKNRQGISVSG